MALQLLSQAFQRTMKKRKGAEPEALRLLSYGKNAERGGVC